MQQTGVKGARSFGRKAQTSRLAFIALVCILLFTTLHVYAGTFLLVNSGDGKIYRQFAQNLELLLKNASPDNSLITTTMDNFNNNINTLTSKKYSAIISAGIEASIAISHVDVQGRIVMAMLPSHSYRKLSQSGEIVCKKTNCHVILLDQPVERQLRLLKLALPERKHVAVIGSQQSRALVNRITRIAKKFGFEVNSIMATNEDNLIDILNQDLSASDVLMAIPDPTIYNANTARAILLTTFNQRIPLFAYSRSFVLAGATLGIYSTPKEIARHVANLLTEPSALDNVPHVLYPRYFSIDINQRAAEALNINISDAEYLVQRLESYEKN